MMKACVIGNPIAQSKSPRIHTRWLETLGLDGEYTRVLSPVDGFAETIRDLMAQGFSGANVTMPFKSDAFEIADEVSDMAALMKSANTLTFKDGKVFADSTDGYGFGHNILDFVPNWNIKGTHVILGAGGAARSIIVWLLDQGAERIILANRTLERAQELAKWDARIQPIEWNDIENHLNATTLVNTTARGMHGDDDIVLDFSKAASELIVNDIVYTPMETGLLKDAKSSGLRTVDGLGMLLWQARPGFKNWFGQEPPAIDDALREEMLK